MSQCDAKKYQEEHPEAAQLVIQNRWMDDIMGSTKSPKEAIALIQTIQNMMAAGNFMLRKWVSNSPQVMAAIDPGNKLPIKTMTIASGDMDEEEIEAVQTLGVQWQVLDDTISLKPGQQLIKAKQQITKRVVASAVAGIFDPLQLAAPFVITGKLILQTIWLNQNEAIQRQKENGMTPTDILQLRKSQWDEELPRPTAAQFLTWVNQIETITNLHLPRCLVDDNPPEQRQLHVFSDASPNAFACAVYLRTTYKNNPATVHLMAAKARVAPKELKNNIPRMELMGTVIAARLAKHILSALPTQDGEPLPTHFWTDSSVALQWITSSKSEWKAWVYNRVREIKSLFPKEMWHHVPGHENPADLATRGITASQCIDSKLWRCGPEWLCQPQPNWPNRQFSLSNEERTAAMLEEKQDCQKFAFAVQVVSNKNTILLELINKFSSLQRLLSVVGLLVFKEKNAGLPDVTHADKAALLMSFVRAVQQEAFAEQHQALSNGEQLTMKWPHKDLAVFLDESGLLRAKGRFPHSTSSPDPPILLPHNHHLTELIIRDLHHQHFHAGPEYTLYFFRRRFWCAKARRTIKAILRKCTLCTRFRGTTMKQVMAPLPQYRVEEDPRPFSITGVDYAGPLTAHEDGSSHKVWILLFTCMQIRAVHLELVTSMDTEALLRSIRRFIARRGKPRAFYSDNGRSFRLAAKEITVLNQIFNHQDIPTRLRQDGIEWLFQVPRAPWWGGLHERMVRTVKEALRAAMFREKLSQDTIFTILVEAEAVVNSRPMALVTDDPSDPLPVSPAMMIQGYDGGMDPYPGDIGELTVNEAQARWRRRLHLKTVFTQKFIGNYIQALRPRQKWHEEKPSLQTGTLVLLEEPGKRLNWPLAKVIDTHPGRDGHVRSATLRTKSGIKKRPVQKLIPLEIS